MQDRTKWASWDVQIPSSELLEATVLQLSSIFNSRNNKDMEEIKDAITSLAFSLAFKLIS